MNNKQFTRRQFLQILGLSAAGAAAWQMGIRPQLAGLTEVTVSRVLMGTVVNLTVVGEDEEAARTAVTTTLDKMSELEAILSRHQENSQLSRLNKNGRLAQSSSHLLTVLAQAQQISQHSAGAFDVTVKPLVDLYQDYKQRTKLPPETAVASLLPLVNYHNINFSSDAISFSQPGMGITVDGIGKGYVVDQGTQTLKSLGFGDVLVEAGGDLLASGSAKSGANWQIGIQAPRSSGPSLLAKFGITNQAVATSGDYLQPYSPDFRHHHILNPRSGYSVPELASATVIAPTAMLADGLATAVMALPPHAAINLLEQYTGVEGYLINKSGEVVKTANFLA